MIPNKDKQEGKETVGTIGFGIFALVLAITLISISVWQSRQPEPIYYLQYNDCFVDGNHWVNFGFKTEQEATRYECESKTLEILRRNYDTQ